MAEPLYMWMAFDAVLTDPPRLYKQTLQASRTLATEPSKDALFSIGGQSAADEGRGTKLPANWDSINAVSEKYGIEMSDNEVRMHSTFRGYRASTDENGRITLYSRAFDSEETLAKTLVYEKYHVQQLEAGMRYPEYYDPDSPWELEAEKYVQAWWANHPNQPVADE